MKAGRLPHCYWFSKVLFMSVIQMERIWDKKRPQVFWIPPIEGPSGISCKKKMMIREYTRKNRKRWYEAVL